MAPVTASTNRDSPKIDLAGVDAGAKILVGLRGGTGSARAAAEPETQTRICEPTPRQFEPSDRNLVPLIRFERVQTESQNLSFRINALRTALFDPNLFLAGSGLMSWSLGI